jgi:hypothetical protein
VTDPRALVERIERDLAELKAALARGENPHDATAEFPQIAAEEFLAPCQLAERLGVGEAYTRKLIKRGLAHGLDGFDKRGGRLFATADSVAALRA